MTHVRHKTQETSISEWVGSISGVSFVSECDPKFIERVPVSIFADLVPTLPWSFPGSLNSSIQLRGQVYSISLTGSGAVPFLSSTVWPVHNFYTQTLNRQLVGNAWCSCSLSRSRGRVVRRQFREFLLNVKGILVAEGEGVTRVVGAWRVPSFRRSNLVLGFMALGFSSFSDFGGCRL